jgi:hypothetical protein
MRRLAFVALIALVASAAASAAQRPTVSGGVPAQAALLRRILMRMGPLHFTSVELLRARSEHWSVSSPDAVLVRFDAPTDRLRTEWEEWLAAGAFMSRSGYAGLPPVSIVESTLKGRANGGMRLSQSRSTHIHRATPAAVGRLRRRLVRVIRRSGGHLDHLSIIRPYGLGYALVVRIGRPAYYLKYRARKLLRTLDDRWTRYEGAYIEVVDSHGRRVWVTAGSSRLQTGGGWIRPDLEGCSPVDVSWPTSHKVPRCPV